MSGYKYCEDEKSLEKVRAELNEDPKMTASQIAVLKRWLTSQPHLRCPTDDHFLLRFLRVTKFNQLECQKMLDNFCTLRASPNCASDWFDYPPVENADINAMLKLGFILPLGQDDDGREVVLFRSGVWDPEKIDFIIMVQTMCMAFDLLYKRAASQIHGFVCVVDFKDFTTAQAQAWDKKSTAKLMLMQNSMPVRIKGVHYINTSMLVNGLFELFKLFMTEDIKNVVYWHKDDLEEMRSKVPPRILPSEYEGTAGPIEDIIEKWTAEFLEGDEELQSLKQLTVDESKRPQETIDFLKGYMEQLSQLEKQES